MTILVGLAVLATASVLLGGLIYVLGEGMQRLFPGAEQHDVGRWLLGTVAGCVLAAVLLVSHAVGMLVLAP